VLRDLSDGRSPDIVTPKVKAIMQGAARAGRTASSPRCAMCHMNLEVRCTLKNPIPIFHFSEILSLAFALPTTRIGSPGI